MFTKTFQLEQSTSSRHRLLNQNMAGGRLGRQRGSRNVRTLAAYIFVVATNRTNIHNKTGGTLTLIDT